jgi:hypothetical protein
MPSTVTRTYRRLRYGRPVIVVSGLPRSGTSMAMRMLEAGGSVNLSDRIRTADESNPVGYYEFERVKELGEPGDRSWLADARGKAVKIISHLLPQVPETLNYKVLFMHRDLDEVIASQNTMLALRGEPQGGGDEHAREWFEGHLWRVQRLLAQRPCFEVLDVSYRVVLTEPSEEAMRISRFLGRSLDVAKMAAVVDARLYRTRR